VTNGAADATFTFAVTNVTSGDITINSVHTSCGCTAAKLPQQPWLLHPGDHGEVGATMHVAGKWGTVTKTLTINSSKGTDVLTVRSLLPEVNSAAVQKMSDRSRNLQVAAADRQAVFRGDCAKCHVEPGVGKTGKELYTAACGVCHDGEHRASMVPALAGRPGHFDEAYWNQWVRNGKIGSLMPAFEMKQGGPLSDDQVKSLTAYLANEFALTSAIAPAVLDLAKPAPVK
jgi:cytochrome c5